MNRNPQMTELRQDNVNSFYAEKEALCTEKDTSCVEKMALYVGRDVQHRL